MNSLTSDFEAQFNELQSELQQNDKGGYPYPNGASGNREADTRIHEDQLKIFRAVCNKSRNEPQ